MNTEDERNNCSYCEHYESGYCWSYGKPVKDIEECDRVKQGE